MKTVKFKFPSIIKFAGIIRVRLRSNRNYETSRAKHLFALQNKQKNCTKGRLHGKKKRKSIENVFVS